MKKTLTYLLFLLVALAVNAQDKTWQGTPFRIASSPSTIMGDVNGDGDVSVTDVMMMVNYLMGHVSDNMIEANADVNGDGDVSVTDVMGVVKIILNGGANGGNGGGIGDTTQAYIKCPDTNHPHMIDLGLPSGTKWACCNVGATTPEGIGGYYAWGETEEKECYDEESYKYYDNSTGEFTNLGETISGTKYDVAHVKWKGPWRMPVVKQISELIKNCSYERVTMNGVPGFKFTGKNGASIFMPEGGVKTWDCVDEFESPFCYWSGTNYIGYDNEFWPYCLSYHYEEIPDYWDEETGECYPGGVEESVIASGIDCFYGCLVRPVVGEFFDPLELSRTALELEYGNQETVDITSGNGNYTVESSNPSVVTVTIEGNKLNITAVGVGEATITITDTKSGETASIEVTSKYTPLILVSTRFVFIKKIKTQVKIVSGSGKYSVVSSNPDVITAKVKDDYIVIEAVGDGEAVITVTDLVSGEVVEINVKVGDIMVCPDDHHPHMIDLGLPSGTKWSCCNVGAEEPEGYGGYYAWGETEEKEIYTYQNYQYYYWHDFTFAYYDYDYDPEEPTPMYYDDEGNITWSSGEGKLKELGEDIAGTDYDVAHVKWGNAWQMPSYEQIEELIDNCTSIAMNLDGVNGCQVTGKNGATIFLPAAGSKRENFYEVLPSVYGEFMSSSPYLNFEWLLIAKAGLDELPSILLGSIYLNYGQYKYSRSIGRSVRPVWVEKE